MLYKYPANSILRGKNIRNWRPSLAFNLWKDISTKIENHLVLLTSYIMTWNINLAVIHFYMRVINWSFVSCHVLYQCFSILDCWGRNEIHSKVVVKNGTLSFFSRVCFSQEAQICLNIFHKMISSSCQGITAKAEVRRSH